MNINLLLIRLRSKWIIPNVHHLEKAFLVVMLILLNSSSYAQSTIKITGVVNDIKGEPLPGVSIKVKGTTTGVTTSNEGKYVLNVPDQQAVLVFTYIGYITKEEPAGNRTVINVSLGENATRLEELVVTGYGGVAKKSDLTGATSSVSAKDIAERQPINLFDALQGKAAGVLVMNDSGEPGAQGSLQIRGPSTFSSSGNAPLYVIDGALIDNADGINPNDIASIEVLKDAASASIYGARAANGVILITTKRGTEGKPQVEAQYSHVFGEIGHMIQQANSQDLRYWRRVQAGDDGATRGLSTDSLNPSYNGDNYLQDMLLGNIAHKNDVKVNVSGGQKGLTYYTSLNYLDDRGIALNSWAKRMQGRINVDFQASPKFKYSNNITLGWQKRNKTNIGSSLKPVFDRPNNLRIYLPDGSLTGMLSSKRNPIANALLAKDEEEEYVAQFNNNLDFQILKDLKFTVVGNAKLEESQGITFSPAFLSTATPATNTGSNTGNNVFFWELQSFLNYNKVLNKNHTISALAGISADRRRINSYRFGGLDGSFTSEQIFVVNGNNIDITDSRTTATANKTQSAFARLNYDYKSRYILSGTFRRDGSSRFGPESKVGNFFSGSTAWRFSDENFMNWSKGFLYDAKLRASYGSLGNDGIGDYESYTLIQFGQENYLGVGSAGLDTKMGNPSIQWENTIQQNFGTDLTFLKGRLGVNVDYYIKTTNALLLDRNLPVETGFTKLRVNIGNVENRGWEFVLSGTPIASKNVNWNIMGNISFEKGKVLKLYNGQGFASGDRNFISVGGEMGDFYGYKQLGIYPYDVSNAYDVNGNKLTPVNVKVVTVTGSDGKAVETSTAEGYMLNGEPYTGEVKNLYSRTGAKLKGGDTEWLDVNKDGIINDSDIAKIGNARPDFYLGIVNNISYKKLSLSFAFNATVGGQVYNSFKEGLSYSGSSNGPGTPEAIYGAWRRQGDIATFSYFPVKDDYGNQQRNRNSYYLEDASFIRLQSVRLNYTLAPKIANRFLMKGLNAYVYGTNLITWTNYTGYDPEFSNSNPLQPGTDGGKYPKIRELGLGLNIKL